MSITVIYHYPVFTAKLECQSQLYIIILYLQLSWNVNHSDLSLSCIYSLVGMLITVIYHYPIFTAKLECQSQ